MKKLLLSLVAVLALAGVVHATSIPTGGIIPKEGTSVWLEGVYNNASADLSAGDLVVWDIDASTGDNDSYVTTTTTANTTIVAGIVYPAAISDGDTGTIAIRGVVPVNHINTIGENQMICSSGTAGKAASCTTPTNDGAVGFSTVESTDGTGTAFISAF